MANKDRFTDPDYLGDGVYVGTDSFQVWIWTSNGITESPAIALEPRTLEALTNYATRVGVLAR